MKLKMQLFYRFAGFMAMVAWAQPVTLSALAQQALTFHAVDAEPLDAVSQHAIVLHDGWAMRDESAVGNDGALFSTPSFDAKGWYSTSVPTTVLGALVRLRKYLDPYVGDNNDLIPDASQPDSPWSKPWWFRKVVEIPEAYAGRSIWLHLDGINYRAAIWVNGTQIASEKDTVGMFRRYKFNISKLVAAGHRSAIAIRIFPDDYAGIPGFRRPGSDPRFQQNVTEMSALGWDWVPPARDRNMGIWQHVWIESSGPVAVWDPAPFTAVDLPGGKQAAVTVKLTVCNASNASKRTQIAAEIRPLGFEAPAIRVTKSIELAAEETREVTLEPNEFPALKMKNPRLWWPHGYGDQPLYRLTVEAIVDGKPSHRHTTQFGVRTIGYYYDPPEFAHTLTPIPDGLYPLDYPPLLTARVFTVNGRPIRMVGGSMVPDFLLSWSAQDYRDQVRLMSEDNHVVVRVWGGGVIPPDVFFEEADRRGLLVWQDLARSSFDAAWRKKEAEIPPVDRDLYLANMRDTILRLRGRTSLLAWCGTNEAIMQTDIGMALQNQILPALDGTRPWIPSTSTEPPWANEPLGMRSFGPYSMENIRYYFDQYAHASDFRFKNEIGMESVPRLNSIEKAIPGAGILDSTGSWTSKALVDHGLQIDGFTTRMTSTIGAPVSLADFVAMADLLSAQSYRAIFEAANKNRPRNPGTMVWMTNAAWLDFNYQMYDWYMHPTASYYSVRSANKPLHVQYAADDNTLQVVSTLPDAVHVHVKATLASADGATQDRKEYDLTALADKTTTVGLAPSAVADGQLHFLALDLENADGTHLDRLVIWTQKDEQWSELLQLPPVTVIASIVSAKSGTSGETEYEVRVVNQGHVPAVNVWLEINESHLGPEVLPSFWSDNAMTLMPGESRLVTVQLRAGTNPPRRLMVEGFNVLPREFTFSPTEKAEPIRLDIASLAQSERAGKPILVVQLAITGEIGPRWTTWPIELMVDGRKYRTFRAALQGSKQTEVRIPLELVTGVHRIQVGDKSIDVNIAP